MEIPFLGGAYEGRSSNVSPETCINWFYEKGESGESLAPTPGATLFATTKTGEVRGCLDYNDKAWFVTGDRFYEVDSNGVSTERGSLKTSTGHISMAHNGTREGANQQIMIVDGLFGYIYDNNTQTLSEITDIDFTASQSVVFMDGYFIFAQKDTDRFWLSGLYDGSTVDPTDFSTAEGYPDRIQALIADRRELYIFGESTLEVWYNAGDSDNTFQRFQGGFTETGLAAVFTPAKFDNSVIWLTQNDRGHGLVAILGDGYQPKIISTPEVNYQISTYSRIDDAFGYAYQDEGHEFYVLTFPTEKVVWVYDASTTIWHRRGHVIDDVFPNRERYNCHTFAMKKHLLGDFSTGDIYLMDPSVGTFNGERIPRERIAPEFTNEERRMRISQLQLNMQEGIGDPNEDDTGMWLSYSKDGGHTYSDEVKRSAGNTGQYKHRVIWRKLGRARNWIFRIRTWTPNKPVLKGLIARMYGE